MATLAALLADVLPTATVVPGAASSLARDVVWVRLVRARVPALDALDPGDLVLVPERALAVVAPGRDQVDALVAALVDGGAAGAVILLAEGEAAGASTVVAADAVRGGTDSRPARPAADLAAGLAQAGIPVAEVAGGDPVAIERSVISWLVNRRAALEARAEELERRLEAVALADGDPTALVAAIGGFLGRAVALEGRRGHPLALHAPARPPAAADAARRYLASRSGVALRVPLPAPAVAGAADADPSGLPAPPRGSLLLLGDEPPTEGERIACERVAALLALELGREVAVARAREEARRGGTLPADGPPWVVLVARQVDDLPATDPAADPATRPGSDARPRRDATVAVPPAPSPAERREALRAELRLLAPPRRLALRGSAESLEYRLVAVADDADPGGLVTADRVAHLIRRPVAVSRPFRDPGDRPQAEAEARATLEAAEATVEGARVVRADRLPAYRILGGLHDMPDGQRLSRALLAPVLAGRPAAVAGRLATLRAVLDAAGPIEAAQVLGVHRNTVAYRIRRLEELGGWDLADPDLRLALSSALRIVQNAQD